MLPLLLALALSTPVENQKPGTPDWELTDPALSREIEGYASKTSVNGGEPIELFVHTTGARYTIDVFRAGWYGGAGARRVARPIDRTGVAQQVPAPDLHRQQRRARVRHRIDPVELGLDGYNAPGRHTLRVSEAAQQMTRTVLARMLQPPAVPRRPQTGGPSTIVLIAALVAGAVVLRAWLTKPSHRA